MPRVNTLHRTCPAALAAATALVALTLPTAGRADVADQVAKNQSLGTFASTVKAAEFGPRLKEAGTVTVFAPSDEAFAKLPAAVREKLLAPEGRAILTTILSYHVVPGNLKGSDIQGRLKEGSATLTPLGGGTLLTIKGDSPTALTVNGARIVTADASTDAGGTVHVIDTVLIPAPMLARLGLPPVGAAIAAAPTATPSTGTPAAGTAVGVGTAASSATPASPGTPAGTPEGSTTKSQQDVVPNTPTANPQTPAAGAQVPGTVVSVIQREPEFATLARLLGSAGLVEELSKPGPFTILAPTNSAFEKLPQGTVDDLLKPENKEKLVAILRNHVVAGSYTSADVAKLGAGENATVKSAGGGTLKVAVTSGAPTINGAKVTKADVKAGNGVIHQIDAVLLPAATDTTDTTGTSGSNATGGESGGTGGGTTPPPANPPAEPAPAPAPPPANP